MKKILLLSLILTGVFGYGQNTFPTAANTAVGIGTGTGAVSGSGGLRLKVTSGTAGTSGIQLTNVTSTTATTSGNSKALSVDSNGNIILTPVVNTAASDVSIYNTDGTLAANRNITMNAKNLTFIPANASSQFFIDGTTGNVGIGNVTPTAKLDVSGILNSKNLFSTNNSSALTSYPTLLDYRKAVNVFGAGFELNDPGLSGLKRRMINFYDFHSYGSISDSNERLSFNIIDRGNKIRFEFNATEGGGSDNGKSDFIIKDKNEAEVFKMKDDGNDNIYMQMGKANSRFILGGYADYAPGLPHKFVVQGGSALIEGNILTSSNIGIGTANFVDGSDTYRLSVDGAIRAHRVRVYTTWADYVFEKNYNLPTLEEVEKHIQREGHLKDIPSAKEVEEKGIELGEINKLLLQKIEELTLYMIEMKKEINTLKTQIKNN